MRRFRFFLGLILLLAADTALGIDLVDLFTVQTGTDNGGCDDLLKMLDDWHQECIDSLQTAIDAIVNYGGDNGDNGKRVQESLTQFFGATVVIGDVSDILQNALDFFNGGKTNTQGGIPKDTTTLHCDSSFLVEKDANNDEARDNQGNTIEVDQEVLRIADIESYKDDLQGGNVPWWSGEHTTINGYYFTKTDSGGRYCNKATNYGLTTVVKALRPGPNNAQPTDKVEYNSVIICPSAFTRTDVPVSYDAASTAITARTSLQRWVPKSATLLHEAFHVLYGAGWLQGDDEFYKLAQCVDKASSAPNEVAINPESYVWFVATMHFLFGDADGGINTNWNFAGGANRAKKP